MAWLPILIGFITLGTVFVICLYIGVKVYGMQSDYNKKLKGLVDEVNKTQKYQYEFDKKNHETISSGGDIVHSAVYDYPTRKKLDKMLTTGEIMIDGTFSSDSKTSYMNSIQFGSGVIDKKQSGLFSNDPEFRKELSIAGSRYTDGKRRIGLMDKLDIHGSLEVDEKSSGIDIIARDYVRTEGETAWMRKDGYVFGGKIVDSKNVVSRESIKIGDGAVTVGNNGGVFAVGNMNASVASAPNIYGRQTVSVGNSKMDDKGKINAQTLCLGEYCLNRSELSNWKDKTMPVDCLTSDWSEWAGCTKRCGGGIQYRWRSVMRPPKNNGSECPTLYESRVCNSESCPEGTLVSDERLNCVISDWSPWSDCSKSCGGGNQYRTQSILQLPSNGGAECPPSLEQWRECNKDACPIGTISQTAKTDCVLTDWSQWSPCTKACGGGIMRRSRAIIKQAANGGEPCPTILYEEAICNPLPCESASMAYDCQMSAWSDWSECTSTCGGGLKTRTRTILKPAYNGGKACEHLVEQIECNTNPCNLFARYVRIYADDNADRVITLTELDVYDVNDNIFSRGKTVTSSSVLNNNLVSFGPLNLVNGKMLSKEENVFNLFHSALEINPWVQLDLGADINITRLVLTNRTDCCQDKIVGLKVAIMNSDMAVIWSKKITTPVLNYDFNFASGIIPSDPILQLGRYIKFYSGDGSSKSIHIAEIDVFDAAQENVSLGKAAMASSILNNNATSFGPSLLVDGNNSGMRDGMLSLAHTKDEVNPWFMIDLGKVTSIKSIVIHNRSDCCSDKAVGCKIAILNINQKPVWEKTITSDMQKYTFDFGV